MIGVAAPDDRTIVRCTLGYASRLELHAYQRGWTFGAEVLLAQLVDRILLFHQGGIGRWWS